MTQDLKTKIIQLGERFQGFYEHLPIEQMKLKLSELESQSSDPNLWDDQNKARAIMQELGDLKKELEEVDQLKNAISSLVDLQNSDDLSSLELDISQAEKLLDKTEMKAFLSGPYDRKNAIVGIHAGQGGTEAMDWASMLFRMYMRFAERRDWKTEVLDSTYGEEAGIKSITFKVEGSFAYGYLKGESGTHRLVRQSPFNADNLRQTSFSMVEVLPELDEVDSNIEIKEDDMEIQFYRSGGHGGQNVNKVSTAVRLKHISTGIVVTAQTERFQEQNRKIAMNLLRAKLWILEQEKAKQEKKSLQGEYRPASWGTQIRSYVLHPYKMVKDLRTEVESGNPDAVLDGDLDEFIDAELKKLI